MPSVIVRNQTPRICTITQKKTVLVPINTTRVVSAGNGKTPRVVVGNRPRVRVNVAEDHIRVVRVGMQGPMGNTGEPGTSSISTGFTPSALPGPVAIGTVPANTKVQSCVVKVTIPFAVGIQMTVGTEAAQGLLLTLTESCLQAVGMYEKTINLAYPDGQEIKAFFIGGPSVTGSAEVTIFT